MTEIRIASASRARDGKARHSRPSQNEVQQHNRQFRRAVRRGSGEAA